MIRLFWVGIILTTFFSTCEKKDINQGEVIASVYGKNLYKTDLESISYKGISFNDSIMRSRAFIDNGSEPNCSFIKPKIISIWKNKISQKKWKTIVTH